MAEDFDPSLLEDPPEVVEELLAGAEEADPEAEVGDVNVAPGEVVGVVDGVEIRHRTDESDHVLPIEDENGELIGKGSFPEVPDFPSDGGGDE
jgi:hypothetical protein